MFEITARGIQTVFVLTMHTIGYTHQLELSIHLSSSCTDRSKLYRVSYGGQIYSNLQSKRITITACKGGGLMRGHHYGMLRAIEWHTEFLLHTCCLTITVGGGGGEGGGGCASFAYY